MQQIEIREHACPWTRTTKQCKNTQFVRKIARVSVQTRSFPALALSHTSHTLCVELLQLVQSAFTEKYLALDLQPPHQPRPWAMRHRSGGGDGGGGGGGGGCCGCCSCGGCCPGGGCCSGGCSSDGGGGGGSGGGNQWRLLLLTWRRRLRCRWRLLLLWLLLPGWRRLR